ncbi:MAG: hypothetical protein CUN55_16670, partial [Phototrophicales bacterium]
VTGCAVFLIWWLVFETEGVYLGRRLVIWLYDVYARRYDNIKQFEPTYEQHLLARPLLSRIAPHRAPLVLDAATGTGRMALALLDNPVFMGRIVAVDLSYKMLEQAASKLKGYQRVDLLWCSADELPFDDNTFDVVTCLEAIEFTPSPEKTLRELARVLRPGGTLLITNRLSKWMPGRLWDNEELADLLLDYGMQQVDIELWQVDYNKVWAKKDGHSPVIGPRYLEEILQCPHCQQALMQKRDGGWQCPN